ncbi:GIY-YIG nuclease family protein [Mesorhizobium sp. M0676]|uniref:GIY-YIG nuclease family protein n=1 Tax=Mesorhizobium sp. M0676 TaxID=2956984 RepID=UPI0033352ECE
MPIYFILEENNADWRMKIGRATNLRGRRGALQTGNSRPLKVVGWIEAENETELEGRLHTKYAAHNIGRHGGSSAREWFYLQPADILEDLKRAGIEGFVEKNADVFEVVGHDGDGVPEYLGVWDWSSLELEECCPFCGCLCGMHFQDASQMFHCSSCDELTDFSQPDFDNKEDYLAWKHEERLKRGRATKARRSS